MEHSVRTQAGMQTANEGKAETLCLLMGLELGTLSDSVRLRIATASDAELELWLGRVLFAETAEEVLRAG